MCNTWEKQLVMYIGSAIDITFFSNNEYWKSENRYQYTLHYTIQYTSTIDILQFHTQ